MSEWLNTNALLHGGDYNPEQWLSEPDILEADIIYMKEAHINVVTLGVFSWSVLEPEEGVFEFDWLQSILDRLYENGIHVILATPSAARPNWLAQKYPEVLRVDEKRRRALFGGRHNHCYTSPVYRSKTGEIDKRLAQRFGSHPAVLLWHISNEFGGECHCPHCQAAFRRWLQERYGTIEELNRRWCTTFWSHTCQSFEQVESPSSLGENELHGLKLDWKRFVTCQTRDFLKHEAAAVRAGGSQKPVTTNCMYYYDGLDYHKFADVLDVFSWDSYPVWHKEPEERTAADTGMMHDIIRCMKKKPFLLMESSPSATNWQPVSKLKKPGMHELSSLQAIAHGSDSVLYFQIRQSRGASEKFHGAVIGHDGGGNTRVFQETAQTGEALKHLNQIAGEPVTAQSAVIYDWENKWALEEAQGPRNAGMHYKETVMKSYEALRRLGQNVDVIEMEQDFSSYKILAAPMLYLLKEGIAERLCAYVKSGGILFLTYWSGIVDQNDRCFLNGTPHGLTEMLGLRSMEMDALYEWEQNELETASDRMDGLKKSYTCRNLCELIQTTTAKTLAVYKEDFYRGYPALTRSQYGAGAACYLCADAEQQLYDDLFCRLAQEAGIEKIMEKIPKGVEVTTRGKKGQRYLFIQNFNCSKVKITLPAGFKTVFGGFLPDSHLKPYGTIVALEE